MRKARDSEQIEYAVNLSNKRKRDRNYEAYLENIVFLKNRYRETTSLSAKTFIDFHKYKYFARIICIHLPLR